MATKTNNNDPAAKAKAEGLLAARFHDEVNLILVTGLVGMSLWAFIFQKPFEDALQSRANSIELILGKNNESLDSQRIYFWLDNVYFNESGWIEPIIYLYITWGAAIYTVFDIIYILLVPACCNKTATIIPHHLATLCLCLGAIYLNVKPLSVICLIVEVNTLILTLKNIKRSPHMKINIVSDLLNSVGCSLHDLLEPVIQPMFLASWVFFRLFYYPFILLTFIRYFNHPRFVDFEYFYVLASLSVLVILNYVWTYGSMGFAFTAGMFLLCMTGLYYC